MEIGGRQQFAKAIMHPLFPFQATTIRAMPVAATVVLIMLMPAMIAGIQMHPQPYRMTVSKILQYTLTVSIEPDFAGMTKDLAL